MTVEQIIKQLSEAPPGSVVRLVLEKPQIEGELYHEAKAVWWDDERNTTFIGDSF